MADYSPSEHSPADRPRRPADLLRLWWQRVVPPDPFERHHRIILVLRVILPLAALALTGLVIAWPRLQTREPGFILSFSEIANYDDRIRMVRPRYAGIDSKNRPFVITADVATQTRGDDSEVSLEGLEADITLADGTWLNLQALTGAYRPRDEILTLRDKVHIFTDRGLEFETAVARVDLRRGEAISEAPVRGQGPFGTFQANRLYIEDSGQRLRFEGGVKATILPGGQG